MNNPLFTGVCTALVTPFLGDCINYPMMERLLQRQIDAGIEAVVICGTTGEAPTLTDAEKLELFSRAKKYTGNHCKIIAGTGSNSTIHTVELSKAAEQCGVDGLLIVSPYYNKATQGGLVRYYSEIAAETKLPIIMYNVPGRTGCNILPETAAKLHKEVSNIVGIKEATGNVAQAAKLMNLTDGKIDLYSGEDAIVLPLLSIGASGVISVWSNVAPANVHNMCQSFFDGDMATAMKLQLEAQPLVEALFSEVNPIPVKKAMNLMGLEVGSLRSPLTEMTDANAAKLAEAMKAYGIKLA